MRLLPDSAGVRLKIVINGTPREVSEGLTTAALLAELDVSTRGVAVEVNFELVPRARHAEYLIHEGDQIEVVTLVGGG